MKSNFKWMLVAILTVCGAMSVYAESDYTITRLSNPTLGSAQLDGYIAGGMHGNDYTQSMAAVGDKVFIATCANLGYAFTRRYNPNWNFWFIAEELYNGRFPFYDPEDDDRLDGSRIISYDTKTKEFKVVYEGENGVGFRSAATSPDGNYAYFAAYTADSRVKPYILRVDKRGNYSKYFETNEGVALRGFCEYKDRLYFGGVYDYQHYSELQIVTSVKLAVLEMHGDHCALVADYKDFGTVADDDVLKTWNDSPIWSLASHQDPLSGIWYIYVTLPSSAGFVIFRGHKVEPSETVAKNRYGWYWEEVAGLNNGVNNPALSEVAGGVPGVNMLSGSLFVFNNKLYACNFDHSIMGELSVFVGGIKALTEQPFNAVNYLNFMYSLLQNPQKVWCLNDLTGKFELMPHFTQHMLSTLNGRVGVYDNQLYVATLDAGYAYSWLSQLAIDDFIHMTPAEIVAKLTGLEDILKAITKRRAQDPQAQVYVEKLEQLEAFLLQLLKDNVDKTAEVASVTDIISLEDIINLIKMLGVSGTSTSSSAVTPDLISNILKLFCGNSSATTPAGSSYFGNIINWVDLLKALGLSDLFPGITKIEDIANMPLSEWKEFIDTIIFKILQERFGFEGDISSLPNIDMSALGDYQELLNQILDLIKEKLGPDFVIGDDASADKILAALLETLRENVLGLLGSLETNAISNYVFIFNRMATNKMGFDLMRTGNGYEFEYITRDGFGDKFNFGCPSFVTTKDGLYIGTSNSFFGGQLWLLTNASSSSPIRYNGTTEDDADAIETIAVDGAQSDYFTLDGRRVSAKAAKGGIYIVNGKKVLVK